jgi:hypothetical protein
MFLAYADRGEIEHQATEAQPPHDTDAPDVDAIEARFGDRIRRVTSG